MPEGTVGVDEGIDKKLHTWQRTVASVAVEDEFIVHGEPILPTYVTDDGAAMNTTTINKHLWQLMAGASKNLYVRRIILYVSILAGAATVVPFSLFRLTTAGTGGTAGTAGVAWDSTDVATGATYMTMPSALGTEGTHLWQTRTVVPAAVPALPNTEMKIIDWNFQDMYSKSIRIPAGATNGIALKNTAALATATYTGRIIYSESTY